MIVFTIGRSNFRRRLLAASEIAERIALADQASKFRQRIALGSRSPAMIVAATIVICGESSVLISISHRDVASLRERRQLACSKRNSRHSSRH
jgi:hypothetical protein